MKIRNILKINLSVHTAQIKEIKFLFLEIKIYLLFEFTMGNSESIRIKLNDFDYRYYEMKYLECNLNSSQMVNKTYEHEIIVNCTLP